MCLSPSLPNPAHLVLTIQGRGATTCHPSPKDICLCPEASALGSALQGEAEGPSGDNSSPLPNPYLTHTGQKGWECWLGGRDNPEAHM